MSQIVTIVLSYPSRWAEDFFSKESGWQTISSLFSRRFLGVSLKRCACLFSTRSWRNAEDYSTFPNFPADWGSIWSQFFLDDFWACPWRDTRGFLDQSDASLKIRGKLQSFQDKQKITSSSGGLWFYNASYIHKLVCLVLSSLGQSATRQVTQ